MKVKISLFITCAIAMASCVDIPDFNNTPEIEYNSIDHFKGEDSFGNPVEQITVTIDFQDGDGDLGASLEERSDSVKYSDWGNYELKTFVKEGNSWVEQQSSIDSNQFFPVLKTDGKSGPIKGTLDFRTTAPYFGGAKLVYHKYKVRIRDRALRVSNQVDTDSILLPRN